LVSGVVVVHVYEGLSLWAEVSIRGKFSMLVVGGVGRDIEHAVVEGLYFAFAKKVEAGGDSFVEVRWLLRLRRVE
jgi:hypothetical protein